MGDEKDRGIKSTGSDLLNAIIKDHTDKGSISDGVFTLEELHSDRACLLVNLIALLNKIYSLKEYSPKLWISQKDNNSVSIEGVIHVGISIPDKEEPDSYIHIGGKVSSYLEEELKNIGYSEVLEAPKYPKLVEILKFFEY
jgi:hypothetical protein